MKKVLLMILLFTFLTMGVAGCSFSDYQPERQTPLEIAVENPEVQDFMNQYPNADMLLDYYPESEIEVVLPLVRSQCGDETIDTAELYKVTLIDKETQEKIATWISWREKKIECVVKSL